MYSNQMKRYKTYVLEVPATHGDIATLQCLLLEEVRCLEDRVTLKFGTCRLLCIDATERKEHPDSVTVREALLTLSKSILPSLTAVTYSSTMYRISGTSWKCLSPFFMLSP